MIESAKGSYSRQLGMFYWRDYAHSRQNLELFVPRGLRSALISVRNNR
jgi:hypothetical protein